MNLESLNSATKYPSILCYHGMLERGRLEEVPMALPNDGLFITEKIDGTNARIIVGDGDYLIGSREELLYAKGDRIGDPSMGIVKGIKAVAERVASQRRSPWRVYFGEFYGRNVGPSSKQYALNEVGFRVFDIADFRDSDFTMPTRECAAWRDAGGQRFLSTDDLDAECGAMGLQVVPKLPARLPIPKDHGGTLAWLRDLTARTQAALDAPPGTPEGVVVRTADRRLICKIRLEDYERQLRRKP